MKNYYTEKEVAEKAREIHGKMWVEGGSLHPKEAIRCALVLVDEQINECLDGFSYTDYRRNFWGDVKNELESYIKTIKK